MTGTFALLIATATRVDAAVFAIAAALILVGAIGVVVSRNPVHAALMLVMTLFGVAVTFIEQQANFLAAVQVIVYAGAIVVLFLFVIMFLGVDREENLAEEPLPAQRPLAIAVVALGLAGLLGLGIAAKWSVGPHSVAGVARGQEGGDVAALGRSVFTTYLFPFEVTAALLVIAVVAAVVLARRPALGRPRRLEDRVPPETPDDAGEAGTPSDAQEPDGAAAEAMSALSQAVAEAVASGSEPESVPGAPEREQEPVSGGGGAGQR